MTKKIISYLWQVIYVKPKGWLCSIQADKLLHFVVSFILMEIMCGVWGSWCWAALATFIIRFFKEIVVDKLVMKENVDTDDLWADIFGIVGALITMWLMYVMLQLIWK